MGVRWAWQTFFGSIERFCRDQYIHIYDFLKSVGGLGTLGWAWQTFIGLIVGATDLDGLWALE